MMEFFGAILLPFRLGISWVIVQFHSFFTFIGIPAESGWAWSLSIIGLVLVIRALLIPLFVKQIKAQRGMQTIQPELKKLQKKYKGKTDQVSRQAMAKEQMEIYKKAGTNPFSACLPMLIQMPFFFSLFNVLNGIRNLETIGALNEELVNQFSVATIFNVPLSASFLGNSGETNVKILAVIMIIIMSASQFLTQKQIMAKNMSSEALDNPFMKNQKILLYILPIVFAVGGINFPIGVLIYWVTSNLWTMGQQFFVIRKMPNPGSPAEESYKKRMLKKGKILPENEKKPTNEDIKKPQGQRNQPKRKDRNTKNNPPKKNSEKNNINKSEENKNE